MNTLEELKYYCKEDEPIGALLLTGEWGCGKTYLIENVLRDELKDKNIILRISLFGITQIEEIKLAVKREWLDAYCRELGISTLAKKAEKVRDIVTGINVVPEQIKGLVTSDFSSLFVMKNKIADKPIVLVFDDLERCQIDYIDVLGVINDYCENMKIHTIIVANQEKMHEKSKEIVINAVINEGEKDNVVAKKNIELRLQTSDGVKTISYSEIKEKIIHRTVEYIPDFESIIDTVLKEMNFKEDDSDYKNFVFEHQNELLDLFAPDREEGISGDRPHNIRSLKCAIRDFSRVYEVLQKKEMQNIDKWFMSFASYVIAYKAGIAREGKYGTAFSDSEVEKLFPAFQSQYILGSIKKWILKGLWEQQKIENEIEQKKKQERASTPCEILKANRIMDIEEEVIINGFSEVLEEAYKGTLLLDEYVQFIMNSFWARKYNFLFPEVIDWLKVQEGVVKHINNLTNTLPEGQLVHLVIGDDNKECFTVDEWNTYELIKEFKDGNYIMYARNRKLYIEHMKRDSSSAFLITQNKCFNIFDIDMAKATAEAFENSGNEVKAVFPGYFKSMWNGNVDSEELKLNESIEGFKYLLQDLERQKKEFEKCEKSFAKLHTESFIVNVRGIFGKINERIAMRQAVDELNNA